MAPYLHLMEVHLESDWEARMTGRLEELLETLKRVQKVATRVRCLACRWVELRESMKRKGHRLM